MQRTDPSLRHADCTRAHTRGGWRTGAVLALAVGPTALAQPIQYTIQRAGFFDAHHTSSEGLRVSTLAPGATGGMVFGRSHRFIGQTAFSAGPIPVPLGGFSAWMFHSGTTTQLGLVDAAHTSASNERSSIAEVVSSAGTAAGTSIQYQGANPGDSAWVYSSGIHRRINLTGGEHTGSDGRQSSRPVALNSSAQVVGTAVRYAGSEFAGRSAWFFDGATTQRIGLCGPGQTRADGFQESGFVSATPSLPGFGTAPQGQDLNASGQSLGWSRRYTDLTDSGLDAWVHRNGISTGIGLLDAEHTRADGFRVNVAVAQNDGGAVVGIARHMAQSFPALNSVWLHEGGTTARLGIIDPEHTGLGQRRGSSFVGLTSTGAVAGNSSRFSAGGILPAGSTAWLYSAGSTTRLGLNDSEHTRSDGFRSSTARFVNDASQVAGQSDRYLGSASAGTSAWLYNAGSHTRLGLVDAEHTSTAGEQRSIVTALTSSGSVVGRSTQYAPDGEGQSVWQFDGTMTRRAGLVDSMHTSPLGRRRSEDISVNLAGDVIGTSERLGGLGTSGWFFDSESGLTTPLTFSTGPLGEVFTSPRVLSANSIVLGEYAFFDTGGVSQTRVFWWSQTDGYYDLGSLVEGGLSQSGWASLGSVVSSSADAMRIAGLGTAIGDVRFNEAVYVMQLVPSPGTVAVLGLFGPLVSRRRRD